MFTLVEDKKKYSDVEFTTNKILIVLSLSVALSFVLMLLNYAYQSINTFMFVYIASKMLLAASVFGMGYGVYLEVKDSRRETRPKKYFTGAFIATGSFIVGLMFYMMAYTNYMTAVKFMYIVIAAAAILYVIYALYQREFFITAVVGSVDALFIWRCAANWTGSVKFYVFTILVLAVIALLLGVVIVSCAKGNVKLGGNKYRFFGADTEYIPFIATLGIIFALTLAVFFVPVGWIAYISYAIFALIFCAAVYYTVKMI